VNRSNDEQASTGHSTDNEWSIEKLLYPDWLYNETPMNMARACHTSTFLDFHSCQTIETSTCTTNSINHDQQTNASNSPALSKHVRLHANQQNYRSYPQLTATIRQLGARTTTTIMANQQTERTFI
jgi:hypothetical protein